MTLTTQHLEELLRLTLQETERITQERNALQISKALTGNHLREADARLKSREATFEASLTAVVRERDELLRKVEGPEVEQRKARLAADERKALAIDVSDASIRLLQAADLLRRRNGKLQGDAFNSGVRMREWAKKLRVST